MHFAFVFTLNTEAASQQISDLIQAVTKKVSDATDVVISGIPPRIDNIVRQHRVEEINTLLQDISAKLATHTCLKTSPSV